MAVPVGSEIEGSISKELALVAFFAFVLSTWRSCIYGIRMDHLWHAVAFPLRLTSLFYVGSIVSRSLASSSAWEQEEIHTKASLVEIFVVSSQKLVDDMYFAAMNILSWRNYVMAPITEELVFRACMIPVLLCVGFKTYSIIFFSPVLFSLAHVNHFLELYYVQRYSFSRAALVVVCVRCGKEDVDIAYKIFKAFYQTFSSIDKKVKVYG